MTTDDVSTVVRRFGVVRVLVLGDLMLDEYLWGHIQRISPEAPVPILNLVSRNFTLGGAGNVAKNLRSLGVQVCALGVVGTDLAGDIMLQELEAIGVDRGVLREPSRTSTRKTRLMSLEHGQQVFRFDDESTHAIEPATQDALLSLLRVNISRVQAILCSDYLKGVLTFAVLKATLALGSRYGLPVIIGAKDSNPSKYRGADVLIHNQRELGLLSGMKVDGKESLSRAAFRVIQQLQLQSLLVTRGGEGMSMFQKISNSVRQIDIPTTAQSVYDVTGAGDTVAAVFTAAVAAGADHETAARLANLAAGRVVGKRGTECVSTEEILDCAQESRAADLLVPDDPRELILKHHSQSNSGA